MPELLILGVATLAVIGWFVIAVDREGYMTDDELPTLDTRNHLDE
jgi:hypothetical protein